MILAVTHSPQSICTKSVSLLAAKVTLINQQFATVKQLYIVKLESDGRWLARSAANDLSTHHSKMAAQLRYRKTIGLKQLAGAIVVQ